MSETEIKYHKRKREIFQENYRKLAEKTDRLFAGLFFFQWLLGILLAFLITPRTWVGVNSQIHIHVYAAIFLGGLLSSLPIYLAITRPGETLNRYVITIAQSLYTILFIHLTGGRIETHFHVFVSLAFIAFYRDIKPLLLATLITVLDHFIRGYFWPESIYGVLSSTPWRALEHSAWVVFENCILFISIKNGLDELGFIAERQAKLEITLDDIEKIAENRTEELRKSQELIIEQQQTLIHSAKLSALGEMSAGIAHEINNPLTIIQMRVNQIHDMAERNSLDNSSVLKATSRIQETIDRITKIIKGLRAFSRDGHNDPMVKTSVLKIIEETFSFCRERFMSMGIEIEFKVEALSKNPVEIECRQTEISQVLLNLLGNALDAVEGLSGKFIHVEALERETDVVITVIDNGIGVPLQLREKIMKPFFTTKPNEKGTGLGLSISQKIIQNHQGSLTIDPETKLTKFVMTLPKVQSKNP